MVVVDKRLNLVIPIVRDDETRLYIHATPLRPETFEVYHLVLAKTFSAFALNGLDPRSGPSVAALILKDVAKATMRGPDQTWWDGSDGVGGEAGLMAEIRRLSNAVVATPDKGWTTLPLALALTQGLLSAEEAAEVDSLLAFFTVVSLVAPRADRARLVRGEAVVHDLLTTLSDCTAFAASLRTSTPAANTGASPPQ